MKIAFNTVLSVVILLLLLASCAKEGGTGPEGTKGEQGPQGIPGKDGAVIHNGNGAPSASLGNAGDMYLDKSSSNLYGPKTSEGWGTALNLKGASGAAGATGATGPAGATGATGATGQAGAAGSKILSGVANPGSIVGAVGDYYINNVSGDLFGPKTASGWGTPINLKGTANVISSGWVNWTPWLIQLSDEHESQFNIPGAILNAVGATGFDSFLDNGGTFLVFIRQTNAGLVNYKFYYTVPGWVDDVALNWYYSPDLGAANSFRFTIRSRQDGRALPASMRNRTEGWQLRYVLIPPGRVITAHQPTDWHKVSYDEAADLLGIQD